MKLWRARREKSKKVHRFDKWAVGQDQSISAAELSRLEADWQAAEAKEDFIKAKEEKDADEEGDVSEGSATDSDSEGSVGDPGSSVPEVGYNGGYVTVNGKRYRMRAEFLNPQMCQRYHAQQGSQQPKKNSSGGFRRRRSNLKTPVSLAIHSCRRLC